VESHSNLIERRLDPTLIAARLTETRPVLDMHGEPILDAGDPEMIVAYGMHSLRHANVLSAQPRVFLFSFA
jgi:integrase